MEVYAVCGLTCFKSSVSVPNILEGITQIPTLYNSVNDALRQLENICEIYDGTVNVYDGWNYIEVPAYKRANLTDPFIDGVPLVKGYAFTKHDGGYTTYRYIVRIEVL